MSSGPRCARRSASRGADPEEPRETQRSLKNTRFALLKNPWNLTDIEKTKLTELPKMNKRLYSAYLLKESFAAILDRRQPNVVLMKLEEWISWAALGPSSPSPRSPERLPSISTASLPTLQQGCRMRAQSTNGKVRTITHGRVRTPWCLRPYR
jgi:hypothetical protein